jgi:hypothetical protein
LFLIIERNNNTKAAEKCFRVESDRERWREKERERSFPGGSLSFPTVFPQAERRMRDEEERSQGGEEERRQGEGDEERRQGEGEEERRQGEREEWWREDSLITADTIAIQVNYLCTFLLRAL